MIHKCDVLIIGAGPAGCSAAIYAARGKLDTIVLDKGSPGGQIIITAEVANYPGCPNDTGPDLMERMVKQAEDFGAKFICDEVIGVDFSDKVKIVKTPEHEYHAKAVIIATGANPRKLGCPGELEFTGKGVSYCATCDADFFRDLEVFVIGGGDTAVEEGMYLTKFARKVYLVHRRAELRAVKSIQEKAFKNNKMEFIWDTVVDEIKGDGVVQSIVLRNVKTGEVKEYKAMEEDGIIGVFPFIGVIPNSKLFEGIIEMEDGYIKTNDKMETNIPGVYAAGDVRVKTLRQVVTATSDGAIASFEAERYIESNF